MFFATKEHTPTRVIILNVYFVVKGEISDNEIPRNQWNTMKETSLIS